MMFGKHRNRTRFTDGSVKFFKTKKRRSQDKGQIYCKHGSKMDSRSARHFDTVGRELNVPSCKERKGQNMQNNTSQNVQTQTKTEKENGEERE